MIETDAIGEIIATYQKHGWILRRVLLSAAPEAKIGERQSALFGSVEVKGSDIDAAWFSRPRSGGGVPWEIRYLGSPPFALLENIDENDPEFEVSLSGVEARLRESIAAKISA